MRITDQMRYATYKTGLARVKEQLDKTQIMIASGKKTVSPSDDPVAVSKCIEFSIEKMKNEQYKRNAQRLQLYSGFYDASVNTVHDLLTRAKELAITQSSSTMDASTRQAASLEVKGIIERLVAVGNTRVGNNYIFGGMKTMTASYSIDNDYNVTFNGTSSVSEVYIDSGTMEKAGISGEMLFGKSGGSGDVFHILKTFSDALEGNDVKVIQEAIDTIGDALDSTENTFAYVGQYAKRIDSVIDEKDARDLQFTLTMSDLADTDMAAVISDFNALSNSYQTLLYALSRMQNMNMLNYM